MSTRVVTVDLISDQITSTNAYRDYWGSADEPTRRLDNRPTYADITNVSNLWDQAYSGLSGANDVINAIVNRDIVIEISGNDETQKTLAAAYFTRGLALGYIGYVYDQGYVLDENTDPTTIELVGYNDLIAAGIASLEQAKAVYQANPGINFDYVTDSDLTSAEAVQLINSYAARLMIGAPRTEAEAASLDYATIRNYAAAGITVDWNPTSTTNVSNGQHSWNTFQINAAGAFYMPADLKIINQFDPTYPKTYPADGVLPEAVTTDVRLISDYFYTSDFGWLRADRNRSIFSNYGHIRFQQNYQSTNAGNGMFLFRVAENRLIQAEAEWKLGNNAGAKAIIDAGERATRGGLEPLADDSDATLESAIFYEYSVELNNSAAYICWAHNRRFDKLQRGRILHFPVPATELEVVGAELYTYGGADFADGEVGSNASGADSWKINFT